MARSLYKGPFVHYKLIKRIKNLNIEKTKKTLKSWSRSSTIIPEMVGHTIAVHNGKQHFPIFISDQMVGHKLGEFVPTRNFRSHIKNDRRTKR